MAKPAKAARTLARKLLPKKNRKAARRPAKPEPLLVLVGTRKGAFVLRGDAGRRKFALEGPHLLGNVVNHLVLDPRDRRTMLMAAKTGHLGPTVFRSTDLGRTWKEARLPPAFRKAAEGEPAKSVDTVFWLTPGHASEPNVFWAGSVPHGLFVTEDAGETWKPVDGFNTFIAALERAGGGKVGGTPDGAITHSITVDPLDPKHLYVGLSIGGLFESRDRGETWTPLNLGVDAEWLPEKDPLYGHDPHHVVVHPARPERLWQQNHCGIYRLDRPGERWTRVGRNMPKEIGDIGFPMVVHPREPDTAWVFPMDGTSVWPRTSPGGKPALYGTRDGGATWRRLDRGLPKEQAWLTVRRQCMCADDFDPVGLYFGTTSGEVWASADEGKSFRNVARHLPLVISVTVARPEA